MAKKVIWFSAQYVTNNEIIAWFGDQCEVSVKKITGGSKSCLIWCQNVEKIADDSKGCLIWWPMGNKYSK